MSKPSRGGSAAYCICLLKNCPKYEILFVCSSYKLLKLELLIFLIYWDFFSKCDRVNKNPLIICLNTYVSLFLFVNLFSKLDAVWILPNWWEMVNHWTVKKDHSRRACPQRRWCDDSQICRVHKAENLGCLKEKAFAHQGYSKKDLSNEIWHSVI